MKRLFISLLIGGLTCTSLFNINEITADAAPKSMAVSHIISQDIPLSRAHVIQWRYKIVRGVLYKRQYNTTKREWVGSWIRC